MPIVSNTSPVLNLAIVNHLSLMYEQFGEILIPQAVFEKSRFSYCIGAIFLRFEERWREIWLTNLLSAPCSQPSPPPKELFGVEYGFLPLRIISWGLGFLGIAMLAMATLETFSKTGFQAALIQKRGMLSHIFIPPGRRCTAHDYVSLSKKAWAYCNSCERVWS